MRIMEFDDDDYSDAKEQIKNLRQMGFTIAAENLEASRCLRELDKEELSDAERLRKMEEDLQRRTILAKSKGLKSVHELDHNYHKTVATKSALIWNGVREEKTFIEDSGFLAVQIGRR